MTFPNYPGVATLPSRPRAWQRTSTRISLAFIVQSVSLRIMKVAEFTSPDIAWRSLDFRPSRQARHTRPRFGPPQLPLNFWSTRDAGTRRGHIVSRMQTKPSVAVARAPLLVNQCLPIYLDEHLWMGKFEHPNQGQIKTSLWHCGNDSIPNDCPIPIILSNVVRG